MKKIASFFNFFSKIKNQRKGLIWRNTGFIITGPTICLCVERGQVIEEFINQLIVFRRGIGVVSQGGLEAIRCFPYAHTGYRRWQKYPVF